VIWFSWRLQRTETLIALGILGLLAALLVPTGIEMANEFHRNALGGCSVIHPDRTCVDAIGIFRLHFQSLLDLGNFFTLVPGLIGVLLAAPILFDLEHGTYRLAWTQSITRGRWLAGKLALLVAAALLAGGALVVLFAWWRAPEAHLDGRLETGIYDTAGVVVIGYTLFALGLALALGAIWRRTAASLTVAFVVYFAVRILFDYKIRDQLVAPVRAIWTGKQNPPASFNNAHVMSMYGTINGHRVVSGGGFFGGGAKFAAPGLTKAVFHAVYQPQSHYWPLQLTETALFSGVAILLIAFAAWRILRTD
jgi:hypothetical protein